MFRILKNKQKGFTLIELMIVVAIIGILAAVAIPQFLDMMKKSKRSEAEVNLDAIKKNTKGGWAERAGFVQGTAGTLPGADDQACCASGRKDRKCNVTETEMQAFRDDTVWADLDFVIDEPTFFVYDYTADDTSMTAKASGDLDCDTQPYIVQLVGTKPAGSGDASYSFIKGAVD